MDFVVRPILFCCIVGGDDDHHGNRWHYFARPEFVEKHHCRNISKHIYHFFSDNTVVRRGTKSSIIKSVPWLTKYGPVYIALYGSVSIFAPTSLINVGYHINVSHFNISTHISYTLPNMFSWNTSYIHIPRTLMIRLNDEHDNYRKNYDY